MSGDYRIDIDLSELIGAINGPISAAIFPTVHQAVRAVASEAAGRWKDAVAKAKLWNGEKQAYIHSITWRMEGDYAAVVETDYKLAGEIETGRPAKDLKRALDTSLKVRVVKKGKNAGKRYLIIPMRHNTPGNTALAQAMPADVYAEARALKKSMVTGNTSRVSGTGALSLKTQKPLRVAQKTYQWGGRLPAGLAPKLKPSHATDPYAGMVRFNTSAGGAKSSSYLTFRVMMEGSSGWVVPPRPGLFLAQRVAQEVGAEAPAVFEQAMVEALK